MYFSLGILSIFQLVFLPGFIFLNILKFRLINKIQWFIYSFAFSLFINYFIVYLLTYLKIYKSFSIYIVIALEFCFFIYLLIRFFKYLIFLKPKTFFTKIYESIYFNSFYRNMIFFLVFLIFTLFILIFIKNMGTVFVGSDATFSWNKWAIELYKGKLPVATHYYPQLLPANFSLSYKIINNSNIQAFAKAIMPIFSISILLMFLDLSLQKGKTTNLVSLIIFGGFLILIAYYYISDGYADIPVTFFSFLTFYSMSHSSRHEFKSRQTYILTILSASAAAITKQAGIYIFAIAFLLIIYELIRNKKSIDKKELLKIVAIILIIIVIAALWYLIKSIEISQNRDTSQIKYVTRDIFGNQTLFQRFLNGIKLFDYNKWLLFILIILAFIGAFYKEARFPLIISIAYIIIWGFFFSYEIRNIFLALPFLAISSSCGLKFIFVRLKNANPFKFILKNEKFIKFLKLVILLIGILMLILGISVLTNNWFFNWILDFFAKVKAGIIWPEWGHIIKEIIGIGFTIIGAFVILFILAILIKLKRQPATPVLKGNLFIKYGLTYLVAALVLLSLLINLAVSNNKLIRQQINLQLQIGNENINRFLFEYKNKNKLKGEILTDYIFLNILPGYRDDDNLQISDTRFQENPFKFFTNKTALIILSRDHQLKNNKYADKLIKNRKIHEDYEDNDFIVYTKK